MTFKVKDGIVVAGSTFVDGSRNTTTNNLTVGGNLTVSGTTTTINTATLEVADLNITVAKNATTAAAANGAGLTVAGAAATLLYTSAADSWNFNKNLFASNLSGTNTGDNPGVTSVAAVTPIISSGGTTPSISHATSGATAGTYNNVTVNTFGHVTAGSNTAYLTAEADTLATVTTRGNSTTNGILVGGITTGVASSTRGTIDNGGALGGFYLAEAYPRFTLGRDIGISGGAGLGFGGATGSTYALIGTNGTSGDTFMIKLSAATGTLSTTPNLTMTAAAFNLNIGALQQAGNQVLHAGNYNSYSPTLTGTGASGTWGINITGTATNATTAANYLPLAGGTMTGSIVFAQLSSPNTSTIQFGDNTGWNFRFMTSVSGTPTTRFTFSDQGAFTAVSTISASNFSGSHSGTSSGTNTGDNPGVTSVAGVTPIVSSGGTTPSISHATSGATAGTYNNVTVNTFGHVTAGSNTAYLTGESDTLATVTGRGNTTTTAINSNTSASINLVTAGNQGAWLGGFNDATTGWNLSKSVIALKPDNTTYSTIGMAPTNGLLYFARTNASGAGTLASWLEVSSAGIANFKLARPQWNGTNLVIASDVVSSIAATSPIITSAATGAVTLSHAASGATAGTYNNVTVNTFGHVTAGSNAAYLTDAMRDRGGTTTATVDTATLSGFYNQQNTGDSHSLLVFNPGGSTAIVQQRFHYGGSMEFRNKTDSATWTAWKTVLTSSNYNSYSPTLTGTGASGTWGINITGNAATATTLQTNGGVSFTTDNSGFHVINAEGTASNLRLGSAWNRPGIYNGSGTTSSGAANSITIGSEDSIYFVTQNVERGRFDNSGNGFATTSFRAPIFYDSNNTAYYADPNSTSNFVGLTVANTITGSITGTAGGETLATVTGRGATTGTAITLSGALTLSNTGLFLNRSSGASTGISWYSSGYTTWSTYMAAGAATSVGPTGNITAPTGTLVTSWALRNTVENAAGYGWTWESGTSSQTAPIIVAELRSSDGAMKISGAFTASNFSGSHSGTSSGTNTGDNPGVTSVAGVTPIVSSGGTTPSISHATSGATAGTYNNVTVNTFGHVTGGSNAGYVSSSGVTSVATSGGYGGLTLTGGTITTTGTITMGGTPTGTWPISVSGNAATATNLSTGRTNWVTNGVGSAVVGMLGWKNYGNNHTIFDASASTAPDGTAISNSTPQNIWSGTYPTLMGWNGTNTYGVRVDAARYADSAGSANETLATVTGRGSSTSTASAFNGGLTTTTLGITGDMFIRSGSPTIHFVDSNERGAAIHNNSNLLYILSSNGIAGESWTQNSGEWPFYINVDTNAARFGGTVVAAGAISASNLSGTNTGDNPGVTAVAGVTPIVSSGGTTPSISHATSGVGAGTYNNVTVNTFGHVTAGSNAGYLTGESDTLATVTGRGASTTTASTFSGGLTASRISGVNNLILNTYTTVNPTSNVFLYSQPNDRDSWIYLDSADTGSNWGIYHRQIDSAVSGLPGNSIGFIGSGSNTLQAWISLANGSANFAGALTQAGNQVLHAGNYTSYSPSLTGGGASGTWGISITGGAATATNSSQLNGLSKVQLWNNSGQVHSTYQTFGAIPDFGVWYMQNSAAADTPQTGSQYYVQTQGLGNDYGYSSYALMTAVARDHAVKYTYYRAREGGTWGAWVKAAAGYADTAGNGGVTSIAATTPIVASASTGAITLSHAASGVGAGTYNNVTVNTFGHVTGGSNAGYVTSSGVTSVATSGGYGGLTLTGGTITTTGTITMGGTPTGTWPISVSGNAATTSMASARTDATAYPVVWGTTGATSQLYSCTAVNIQSSTGTLSATIVTSTSDARVKTNIRVIDNALNKVMNLRGITYDRSDVDIPRQTGVIAQEVLEVLPEAVTGSEDTQYAVAYGNMVGLLVEAIKEQQSIIDSQESRIAKLEALVSKLIEAK